MRRNLVLLALLLPLPLAAQPQRETPQVVVTGHAEATIKADMAMVALAVQSNAPTAAEAGAQNAPKMAAVRRALVAAGISPDSITSTSYSVQPDYDDDGNLRNPASYVATNAVHVRTRRLDQVGRIIDTALAAGANRVDAVNFSASSTEAARRRALADAIAAARADAEAMAAAGGGGLGELLELTTGTSPIQTSNSLVMIRGLTSTQTYINASDIVVNATVNARWRFVPR
jgi:uncharacterized protein YggE